MAVLTNNSQLSAGLYSAFWNRAPDATGQNFWVNKLNTGAITPLEMATAAYNAPEGFAAYPSWIRNDKTALITEVYQSVFNRDPDAGGLAFWTAQLTADSLGNVTNFPQVVLNMMDAAINSAAAGNTDGQQFLNEIQVGIYVSEVLRTDDPAITSVAFDGVTYQESSVAIREAQLQAMVNVGQTYTLTTAADNIVGTNLNDTVNGYLDLATPANATFQVIDTINGKGGVNTLNLTVGGATAVTAANFPLANISNMQVFSVRDLNSGGASTYDMSLISGETAVVNNGSSKAVTFDKVGTGASLEVKGAVGATTLVYATATDAATINLNGATGASAITDAGSTSATINTVLGAANSNVGAVALGAATAVTINANSGLTTTGITGATDSTLTVNGSGAVALGTLAGLTTVAASAQTGGLSLTAAASSKSIVTGSGADTVTLAGALAATGKVDLGAGNDTFLSTAAANVVSTNVIDGGLGIDTMQLLATNVGNAAAFKNFEQLNVDGLAAATYDVSLLSGSNTFTGLVANAADANAAIIDKVAAGVGLTAIGAANISAAGAGYTIVQTGATGTADSFNVNFAATGSAAQAQTVGLTLNNIETINVVSGGGTGDTNTFNLWTTAISTGATSESIVITGANALTTNVAGVSVANTVNAAAATGAQTVTGSATTTAITGGSAADTLNVAALSNTSLTGGAGNDTFNVASNVVVSGTALDYLTTITAVAADDIINTAASGGTAGTALGAATDVSSAVNLYAALTALATAANTMTTTDMAWAVIGGNTYLVSNASGSATITGDNVIMLTGVQNLANSTVNATGDLTIV